MTIRLIIHPFNYPISAAENWAKAHENGIPFISPGLKARANENINIMEGFSPKLDLTELAQAVQRTLQQFTHPAFPADVSRQFAQVKKAANALREEQIGHLLETICTLGLLSAALN